MEVFKKLSAPKGTLFGDIEKDMMEGFDIKAFLPDNIKENLGLIKPVLDKISNELGDDKNIGIIRKVNGDIVAMLLKTSETDIDIKSEKTIIETFNISSMLNELLK